MNLRSQIKLSNAPMNATPGASGSSFFKASSVGRSALRMKKGPLSRPSMSTATAVPRSTSRPRMPWYCFDLTSTTPYHSPRVRLGANPMAPTRRRTCHS